VASTKLGTEVNPPRSLFQAAAIFWVLAGPFVLLRKPALAQGAWRLFLLLAGIVVFAACWHALVAARAKGVSFVLSLLLVVWLADIGAYFAGKAFGRHKLAPAISPGKTWEGAIGGWLAVVIVAALAISVRAFEPTLYSALLERLGAVGAVIALTVLVVFSVIGDLFESMLKRQAGVKDSSGLLPGHGGVLDRIDALLPVLPLAMLLLHFG
jgi:phosphatidate cytidylyltransferase